MTFITFWFTNIYNRLLLEVVAQRQERLFHTLIFSSILQKIILRNGSEMFEYWTTPPIDPIIKVYVFNYSNIAEVESGVDKLIRLQEVGPYVYRERIVKTGLIYEGDKITFHVSDKLKVTYVISCH
jgi:scavenger receptor class B, member 1